MSPVTPSSLLRHYQGAIAGAWQAEGYGYWCLSHAPKHLWLAQGSPLPWQTQSPRTLAWTIADRCAQDLIEHGQVWPDHWLGEVWGDCHREATASPTAPLASVTLPTEAEILLALLPVALFAHDTPARLAQAHQSLCLALRREWPEEPGREPDWDRLAAAWGVFALALAQVYQGNREPVTLIPSILAALPTIAPTAMTDDSQASTEMARCLQAVQQGLTQGAGLVRVVSMLLEPAPEPGIGITQLVAIALYCYLSAPRDFRCAVVRSVQATRLPSPIAPGGVLPMAAQLPGLAALTGALAGSYHGGDGLPLMMFPHANPQAAERNSTRALPRFPFVGPTVLQQMLPLAAAWAGAYQPRRRSSLPPVTLPRVYSSP